MTVAFTICSNNYLAQAISLAESYLKYHPTHLFKIGLVDRLSSEIEEAYFNKIEIIPVEKLGVVEFEELKTKYNITELNTSVKPSYFKYIFQNFGVENVIYLDPDILIFSALEEVGQALQNKNIVVTPHLLTPIDDEYAPSDYHTLRGGVFNLGFIALSNYSKVSYFLNWWHDRVVKYGYADFSRNMFYDQLWLNYLPVLFDDYFILKHPGYNMANWNLHERILMNDAKSAWLVNEKYPLRFFHYSGYKLQKPAVLCSYNTRFDFNLRPDVKPIFDQYYQTVMMHGWSTFCKIKCVFERHVEEVEKTIWERIKYRFYIIYRAVIKGY